VSNPTSENVSIVFLQLTYVRYSYVTSKLIDIFLLVEKGSSNAPVSSRCPNTKKLYDLTGFKAMIILEDGQKKH